MPTKSLVSLTAAAVFCFVFLFSTAPARTQGRGQPVQLPDGPGKEMVQTTCTECHALNLIVNSGGYTRQGWQDLFGTMVTLPNDQRGVVADYLAKNYPEQPRPPAVVIPGDVKVTIKEWVVPTLGSRPHDPLATADGAIWWAGMYANVLGRLDPKTGEVTEFKMPVQGARDPHTPIFDKNGTLWFTLQGSNMIGRLIPSTSEITLVSPPTERTNPYGMVVDSKGTPWFVQLAVNKLSSIDPKTMVIKEYTLPNAETRPRRVAITSDDALWYGDYSRGYLGRFDP